VTFPVRVSKVRNGEWGEDMIEGACVEMLLRTPQHRCSTPHVRPASASGFAICQQDTDPPRMLNTRLIDGRVRALSEFLELDVVPAVSVTGVIFTNVGGG
jgi:hypothetical protein